MTSPPPAPPTPPGSRGSRHGSSGSGHRWTLVLIVAVLVAASVAAVVVLVTSQQSGVRQERIQSDGARLAATVYTPSGDGAHPLVVMPAAWGADASMYAGAARGFAKRGYAVVAYAQRGFGASTGTIDFAGPATVRDVTTVINWAEKHLQVDRRHIAAVGLSYGAGVSLLAAERDPRISTVVAMSGWADVYAALFPGDTANLAAIKAIFGQSLADGRLDRDGRAFAEAALDNRVDHARTLLRAMSPSRSAITDVAALNERQVPVLLAGSYNDAVLDPGQLLDFYAKLTGPKRLQLAAGDHGQPEYPGLSGRPDGYWTPIADWLDHYLGGADNDVADAKPVQLRDAETGAWHGYPSVDAVGAPLGVYLGGTTLEAQQQPQWQRQFAAGDTGANVAAIQFDQSARFTPETVPFYSLDPIVGATWLGPALPSDATALGRPELQATVRTTSSALTLFAYLYDVAPDGTGTLLTAGTRTLTSVTPGAANRVSVALSPFCATVSAGHRVALVLDSVDPRYATATAAGSTIIVESGPGAPDAATLVLRLG